MEEKVAKLVQEALEERPSLFLISLTVTPANQITVVIDGDEGVTVQDCVEVSRAVEHQLNREETDFSLEVFSAGVSEPLQQVRQYQKNVGRELKVTMENSVLNGTLSEVTENNIVLQWKVREPKPVGKGKHTVQKEATVPYTDIKEAKVMVKFK